MQITIMAFGIAKDILGQATLPLQVPSGSTVHSIKEMLCRQYPEFQRLVSLSIAVNAEYAKDEQILLEQDEVVIIPPVSGG